MQCPKFSKIDLEDEIEEKVPDGRACGTGDSAEGLFWLV